MKTWVKALASFGFIGYAPLAPGTLASLAGLGLAWLGGIYLIPFVVLISLLGFFLCKPAVEVFQSKDPLPFVLDEVCGMMLGVAGLPRSWAIYLIGFVLFRVLDVWKPWPIAWIQKSEKSPSIMWDDLAAGALTNLILQIFVGSKLLVPAAL